MARYTGPKTRIARKFGEAIFGADKVLSKKNYPPGSMVILAVEKHQNMVSCWLKNRKQNILTEFWKNSSVTCLKRLQV